MKAALSSVVTWFGSFGDGRAASATRPETRQEQPRMQPAIETPVAEPPAPPGAWTPTRLRFAAALWGEGFTGPGGEEEALRLSKPLGLHSSHSLLNLGAGLGGAARAITTAWGAWVSAYEQDPDLAAAGEALSKKAKLEKKAEVKVFDPAAPAFRPNYYHHALVQEAFWTIADKERTLAALTKSVKPGGQVVITDLTLGAGPLSPEDETARAWAQLDRSPAHLCSAEEETALLLRHGLDLRIAEDISARHVSQAVAAWRGMIEVLVAQPPTRPQALLVIREAELWLRRLALIRSGRLRLMRWHALRR